MKCRLLQPFHRSSQRREGNQQADGGSPKARGYCFAAEPTEMRGMIDDIGHRGGEKGDDCKGDRRVVAPKQGREADQYPDATRQQTGD